MNIWQAIILGLIEGITEYLPISSTGHLVLGRTLVGLDEPGTRAAVDAYIIAIQGGAILAVLGLYRQRVGQMIAGVLGRDPAGLRLALNLVVAFLPAAVLGPLLHGVIVARLFRPGPVVAALAVGGVVMIALGPWHRRFYHEPDEAAAPHPHDLHEFVALEQPTWPRALLIGLLQCVAMWPGTSRSMVTIVGGMLVGMRARHAAEFSFLLALPTLGGACVYSIVRGLAGGEATMFTAFGWWPMIVGFATATISAAIAVTWLLRWLTRHGLAVFGWYRLAIAALFIVLISRGVLSLA